MRREGVLVVCAIFILSLFVRSFIYFVDKRGFAITQNNKLRPLKRINDVNKMDDTFDRIFWFIQVTDIHISNFNKEYRAEDLKRFCKHHIPIIGPDIFILSGDITDAKTRDDSSAQFIDEWKTYESIISDSGVSQYTKVLDIRGNHDAFNVPHAEHTDNLFSQYSVQGRRFSQSYMYTHQKDFGRYSFIGLDACLSPGIKRPLNNFGILTASIAKLLQLYGQRARGSNQTFWFGHYPTSGIVSPGFDLRALIGQTGITYVCGHLHTCLGKCYRMYSLQPQGFLEMELGDWRDERFYRIIAVDNDIVSFVDANLVKLWINQSMTKKPTIGNVHQTTDWPVVLITNPKHAGFLLPHKEPLDRIGDSSHIRILAWSQSKIRSVLVSIDGNYIGEALPAIFPMSKESKLSPLFVLPWKPSDWKSKDTSGTEQPHRIEVVVTDEEGLTRRVEQPFSVTGTPHWDFKPLTSFILLSDHWVNLRVIFYTMWISLLLTLILLRYFKSKCLGLQLSTSTDGLHYLVKNNRTFYSLVLYLLYEVTGPVYMGFIIDHHFGLVFSFGVFIANTFISEPMTFFMEIIQMVAFNIPATILLIKVANRINLPTQHKRSSRFTIYLTILTIWQLYVIYISVYRPYGLLPVLLSPGRLGPIGLTWFCFYHLQTYAF